jgi:hypothetical protein
MTTKPDAASSGDESKPTEDRGRIAGMGGGIAGPAEPGAAGTAGGGTAIGGETGTTSVPGVRGVQTELSEIVAEALGAAAGKKREAVDENADRETGSPGAGVRR